MAAAACSVTEDYETLSFWFDGVPTPEQLEAEREAKARREEMLAAAAQGPLSSEQRAAMLAVRVQQVEASTHRPVEEKQCTSCHVMTGSEQASASAGWMSDLPELKVPPQELCLGCHERPTGTYVHGPAASGNCSLCHQAHTSLNPHLLRNAKQAILCRSCHQGETFITEAQHPQDEDGDCVDCHHPHQSEREFLLRPGVTGLTWRPPVEE